MAAIQQYSIIKSGEAILNGELLHKDEITEAGKYFKSLYKALELNYPKYFKMDMLCKLGVLAAEMMLKNEEVENISGEQTAIILANQHSSLYADNKHAQSISGEEGFFPSPAVFVYTLPNIVIGEIAIKYGIKGEQMFFVEEKFNLDLLLNYANVLFERSNQQRAICGWVDVDADAHNYLAVMLLVSKDGVLKITQDEILKYVR